MTEPPVNLRRDLELVPTSSALRDNEGRNRMSEEGAEALIKSIMHDLEVLERQAESILGQLGYVSGPVESMYSLLEFIGGKSIESDEVKSLKHIHATRRIFDALEHIQSVRFNIEQGSPLRAIGAALRVSISLLADDAAAGEKARTSLKAGRPRKQSSFSKNAELVEEIDKELGSSSKKTDSQLAIILQKSAANTRPNGEDARPLTARTIRGMISKRREFLKFHGRM